MNRTGYCQILGGMAVAGFAVIAGGCASGGPAAQSPENTAVRAESGAAGLETAELRERALSYLVDQAANGPPELRANAIESLGRTAPARLRPVIAKALTDENVAVRTVAAMMVGRSTMQDQAAAVHPLLNDASPMVRAAAIYALRRCGEDVDVSPLGSLLQDPSSRVRAHTAFILGELGDRSAIPMLKEAERDVPPRASMEEIKLMQLQMAEARVKLGDETGLPEIRAALYPSRPEELEATALAAQIIGLVNDRGAISQLVYLTARRDETKHMMPAEIRLAAAASLAKLGLRRGTFLADEYAKDASPALRAQAAFVYGETGLPTNLPPLRSMLEDREGIVRVSSALAIVKVMDRQAAAAASGLP